MKFIKVAGITAAAFCVVFTVLTLYFRHQHQSLQASTAQKPFAEDIICRNNWLAATDYVSRRALIQKAGLMNDVSAFLNQYPGFMYMVISLKYDSVMIYVDCFKDCGCPNKDFQLERLILDQGGEWIPVLDTTLGWNEYLTLQHSVFKEVSNK